MLPGLLQITYAPIQNAQTEMAMGHEWTHAQLVS